MKLSLHIPGLLAAPRRLAAQLALPRQGALHDWLRRASAERIAAGRHGFIAHSLALQQPPLAALAWLGSQCVPPERPTLLATPVHLRAGMHDLLLFAGPALAVTPQERERLAADIAAFLGGAPAFLAAGDAMFLQADALDVRTTPLHAAQGEMVRERLPRGPDAGKLHRWMNELQMLLHDHAVNRERQARDLPALNGIWLWGEGELPPVPKDDRIVFAQSAATRGLGRLLGEAREVVDLSGMLPREGHHVVESLACIDALDADDADAWRVAVQAVSEEWLQPVLDWLEREPRAEAVLYAGDDSARRIGRDSVLARWRRRFSRRAAPAVMEEHGGPE